MTALRKITVQVPEDDLEMAQAYTGEGVTDTVRAALKKARQHARAAGVPKAEGDLSVLDRSR